MHCIPATLEVGLSAEKAFYNRASKNEGRLGRTSCSWPEFPGPRFLLQKVRFVDQRRKQEEEKRGEKIPEAMGLLGERV
jgi:hypothetical protein